MPASAPIDSGRRSDIQVLVAAIDELPSIPDTLFRILRVLDNP